MRYQPAIVAGAPAALQILAEGRFTLGLGGGENPMNTWSVAAGQLSDAGIDAARGALFGGELVSWKG
jgi:alkanesulfonate monooxygenase SsuD/methylene tetrahydromethanopterin reductase-like flavin-dependent oxidoreductase (luciferase family)